MYMKKDFVLTFTHNLLIYLLFHLPLLCDNLCCKFILSTPVNGTLAPDLMVFRLSYYYY